MITDATIEIDAPPAVVWDVFADVERWHEWTASITSVAALDGPGLEVGKRFRIKQPRFPSLEWAVTAIEPGVSWTWVQRSPGGTTRATHELVPLDGGRTLVRQRIDQRGAVGVVVGVLTRRLTRRYLDLEGRGLKSRSEQQHRRGHASPA